MEFSYRDGRLSDFDAISVHGEEHTQCEKYCLKKRSGSEPCVGYTFIKNERRNVCQLKTLDGTKKNQTYWTQESGSLKKGKDGVKWLTFKNTVWKNEMGELSSMRIRSTDSVEKCQQFCVDASSNSDNLHACVGYTFQAKKKPSIENCYLKSSFDAKTQHPVPLEKHSALIKG